MINSFSQELQPNFLNLWGEKKCVNILSRGGLKHEFCCEHKFRRDLVFLGFYCHFLGASAGLCVTIVRKSNPAKNPQTLLQTHLCPAQGRGCCADVTDVTDVTVADVFHKPR